MTACTPFSKWSKDKQPDPHGDHYAGDDAEIAMKEVNSRVIAELFPMMAGEMVGIAWLTTQQ